MARAKNHLFGLDILRFWAALAVCLNHFATYSREAAVVTPNLELRAFPRLALLEHIGAVGVQIFFVISGFVIAYSASSRKGHSGAAAFATARLWRLVPALWLSSLIGFAALWINGTRFLDLFPMLTKSLFLLPVAPHIDGVIWTLMVEVVFYVMIGLSIRIFGTAPLVQIALGLGVASGLYLILLLSSKLSGWTILEQNLRWFPFTLFLLRHGVFFALGMLIWARELEAQKINPAWFVLMGCFGVIEIWFAMQHELPDFLVALFIFAAAMRFFLWSIRWTGEWPYQPLLRWLGDLSYPLYLNHFTIGMSITYWMADFTTGAMHIVASFCGIFAVSLVVLLCEKAIRVEAHPRGIFKTTVRPPLT